MIEILGGVGIAFILFIILGISIILSVGQEK